jgi:hypothetical protein
MERRYRLHKVRLAVVDVMLAAWGLCALRNANSNGEDDAGIEIPKRLAQTCCARQELAGQPAKLRCHSLSHEAWRGSSELRMAVGKWCVVGLTGSFLRGPFRNSEFCTREARLLRQLAVLKE